MGRGSAYSLVLPHAIKDAAMLARIKALFADPPSAGGAKGVFAPDDARVAVAALLVHMIRIDGQVNEAETATIREALDTQFGLSGADLDAVLDEARQL